jgi:hypothetical protein
MNANGVTLLRLCHRRLLFVRAEAQWCFETCERDTSRRAFTVSRRAV